MTVQSPIPDFAAAREAMVESQLRPQGVTDPAVLAAMGRTEEQQQFRRTLAKRTQAALTTENYGLLERYIQGWYLHVIALQTRPGWAAEWDRLRRNAPTVADPDAAEPLEDILGRLRS